MRLPEAVALSLDLLSCGDRQKTHDNMSSRNKGGAYASDMPRVPNSMNDGIEILVDPDDCL